MLIEIGSNVSVMLRDGTWKRSVTVLNLFNGAVSLTIKDGVLGPTQTLDMNKDVAIIEKSSLISL